MDPGRHGRQHVPRASTETGTVLGTAGYMSPEQAQAMPVDARSDIFSLGCILYEVIAGRRAFQGASPIDSLHKIVHEAPPSLSETSPPAPSEARRIVQKALAKSPDERYQTARDLTLDLRALLRDLPSLGASARAASAPRRTRPARIALAAILILLAGAAALAWRRATRPTVTPAAITFRRITAKGNLIDVAISPDGRFIAYSQYGSGGEGLWLRQIASGEDLQVVPNLQAEITGCTFTPDGNEIVYVVHDAREPRGAIYRVSTIGGPPRHLVSGIDGAPSFSPDGKWMTWVRAEFPSPDESALMVADRDGTGERAVAVRHYPELFAPIFFTRPSWSPDGTRIAVSVKRLRDPDRAELVGVDPDTGAETSLSQAHWVSLSALQWLPDGKGILAIAASTQPEVHAVTNTGNQIWLIPYPSGEPRRVTNDVLYYRTIGISADGRRLVTDVADAVVNVAKQSLDGNGTLEGISSGHFDGVGGLSVMSDGRLVLSSIENGTTTLWVMNADGSGRRPLLKKAFRDEYPVAFAGGVAYVSFTIGGADLCVVNGDGEQRRVVVGGIDDAPIAAREDGKAFVYSINSRLWEAFADGRPPRRLSADVAFGAAFSPDGDRLAFLAGDQGHWEPVRVVVVGADGAEVWSAPSRQVRCHQTRWARDGSAVLVSTWKNIWSYPLHGEPKELVRFDDLIWSFDLSPDRLLFVARGAVTRDAEMITGFR